MKIKKSIIAPIITAALMFGQAGNVFADDSINVYLKGRLQTFEQPPIIKDGSTLVPMRAIFEALGATVEWDGDKKIIDATKEGKTIRLQIGWKGAWIGQTKADLDVAPEIVNGSTMVPLRFVGEALGEKIEWDGDTRSVLISTDKSQLPKPDSGQYKGYADALKQTISDQTETGLGMSDATYQALKNHSDAFFAPQRDPFALMFESKDANMWELTENPAKYNSTITPIRNLSVSDIKEITLDNGEVITVVYGLASGTRVQIFSVGKSNYTSNTTEIYAVPVGETTVGVVKMFGIVEHYPSYVFVGATYFTKIDEVLKMAENGKGQPIEFDEETQKRLDKGKTKSYVGEMGLISAAEDGLLDEVKRLIESSHVDVNALPDNRTALMGAASKGNEEIVKYLLSKGANPNAGFSFTSPLSSAAYGGNVNIVKMLIEAGAVPNSFALDMANDKPEILTLLKAAQKSK